MALHLLDEFELFDTDKFLAASLGLWVGSAAGGFLGLLVSACQTVCTLVQLG